jgi:hypothetical protein
LASALDTFQLVERAVELALKRASYFGRRSASLAFGRNLGLVRAGFRSLDFDGESTLCCTRPTEQKERAADRPSAARQSQLSNSWFNSRGNRDAIHQSIPVASESAPPGTLRALDTAALMLGSDKSRGYCLEMICADFLAGAHLEDANQTVLLSSTLRLFRFLPAVQQQEFLREVTRAA